MRSPLVIALALVALVVGGCGGRSAPPTTTHGHGYHPKQGY